MQEQLIRMLVELVVDLAMFFDSCDDSVLDPDDAVKQLEWIGYKFAGLSPEARQEVIAVMRDIAARDRETYGAFLATWIDELGAWDEPQE
ncbi:hypothetical protein [Nonomuraea africana]|uniref:Uncharacterized protein n=1 Tax=Nonomuraea africana TaxID=46171 RepID=A0ABR9KAQ4_9ACTN|nr:hypothetical protein [Nonomuraea africana]MBE1559084.1 hypothetical protein [Nonomuraea africana]